MHTVLLDADYVKLVLRSFKADLLSAISSRPLGVWAFPDTPSCRTFPPLSQSIIVFYDNVVHTFVLSSSRCVECPPCCMVKMISSWCSQVPKLINSPLFLVGPSAFEPFPTPPFYGTFLSLFFRAVSEQCQSHCHDLSLARDKKSDKFVWNFYCTKKADKYSAISSPSLGVWAFSDTPFYRTLLHFLSSHFFLFNQKKKEEFFYTFLLSSSR